MKLLSFRKSNAFDFHFLFDSHSLLVFSCSIAQSACRYSPAANCPSELTFFALSSAIIIFFVHYSYLEKVIWESRKLVLLMEVSTIDVLEILSSREK